jgi:ABC-2 type transport system permease protein
MMNSFIKLSIVQFKTFMREPAAFFFTLVFPVLLLTMFGLIWGNEPAPPGTTFYLGGFGYVDYEVPALAGLIIGTTALMSIPVATATAREQKILRRFKATPLHPLVYLASDVVVYFAISLMGMILLIIVGLVVFGLRFNGSWFAILGAFTLSSLAFIAAGYLVAGLAPTARIAQVVGQLVYFPMMFLSGAAIPLQLMPEGVQNIAELLPMTMMVRLLQDLWFGVGWHIPGIVFMVVLLVVGTILSARTFRWE